MMLILRALHSGKGRYYISFEEAARNVRRIMNRLPLARRNELKVSMYQELAQRVAEYMKEKPLASFKDAFVTICTRRMLPRFFFGMQTARSLIYIVISRGRNCMLKLCCMLCILFSFFLVDQPIGCPIRK
ncbi:MAG: hypothetical protein V8R52_06815 [Coprobacter fastidiosus]